MSRFSEVVTAGNARTADGPPSDVTVGIDFGTSSCKVAFREFGGQRSTLLPSPRGHLLWPCVVRVRGRRLYFDRADDDEGNPADGSAIRWLKMLLAEDWGAERDEHRSDMRYEIGRTGCSVQCLTTLLLAHVVKHARRRVSEYFATQGRAMPHLTFNMGAPLETFGPGSAAAEGEPAGDEDGHRVASDGFLQALYWAEKLADDLPGLDGWSVADARDAFDAVRRMHPSVPAEAGRNVFVVPETHAVVTGAVLARRRLESGQYAIVDIGAGTTDVAVFSYHAAARKEGRWAVTYLADAVKHEASTQADWCIGELIWERMYRAGLKPPHDPERLELARRAKEQSGGKASATIGGELRLSANDIRDCVSELSRRLFKHYRKTLIDAVRLKTKAGLREPFHLLLLGGGSRFAPFRQEFVGVPPSDGYPQFRPIDTWISLRDHLRVLVGSQTSEVPEADYELYSLVHGLTTHIVRLPAFWLPGDVDDLPPPPPADRSPYLRNDDT